MANENAATVSAPVTAPAAAPAAVSEPAAPKRPESISEKMERLGWEKDTPHGDNPESLGAKSRAREVSAASEEPAKTEQHTDPKPKANEPDGAEPDEKTKPDVPKPKTDAAVDAKREQLKALIAELGMQLDDTRVTSAERAALRGERRDAREALEKLENEAKERIAAATKALEERDSSAKPRFDKLSTFEKAIESGDHDQIAKVAGFEDWDKLQEHVIALKADPAYQRMRALERQVAERERAEKEREEKAAKEAEERTVAEQRQAEERAQQQARAEYMRGLSATMAKSEDPVVKAMADDPAFVGAVFRVQQSHYAGGDAMTPEEAIRTAAKGTQGQPLVAELKKLYDRLAPVFGQPQPSAGAVVASVKAEDRAERPKAKRTPAPSPPPAASKTKMDDREWKVSAARRLEEAVREERRANGAR